MPSPQPVTLLGFSDFERAALLSYFRLGDGAATAYRICEELTEGGLVVADADRPDAVYAVTQAGRLRDAILIGGSPVQRTEGLRLARPIDALQLRRALDVLARRRKNSRRMDDLGTRRLDRPSGRAPHWSRQTQGGLSVDGGEGFSNAVLTDGEHGLRDVLVVSNSPAERQVLSQLLNGYGYPVSLACDAAQALAAAAQRPYRIVFMGMAQDLAGKLHACRQFKQPQADGGPPPVVIALTRDAAPVQRIRASFAGCDDCLAMPLDEAELLQLLTRHDATFERVFEPTAPMRLAQ